jgi:tryptophan synthase alpha chain
MTEARLMTHLVAGYPDLAGSREAARAMTDGGAAYLEIQFPYSDPTADGPLIQRACDRALRSGFRVRDGFALVRETAGHSGVPVFIMSYAGLVYARGVRRFMEEARAVGAAGVIVPDLPVDADEGLYSLGGELGLEAVPVVSPNVSASRLELIGRDAGGSWLYAALRSGTTGAFTEVGGENLAFLERVAGLGRKVIAGFGVSRPEQVRLLAPHVHSVVVGSAFIRAIEGGASSAPSEVYRCVRACLRELSGA